jgi:hypothetical protein
MAYKSDEALEIHRCAFWRLGITDIERDTDGVLHCQVGEIACTLDEGLAIVFAQNPGLKHKPHVGR